MKDTTAIDVIIADLALKDYLVANPRKADGRPKYKKYRPYTLSAETNEARKIREDYVSGAITEKQYDEFCRRYNV